MVSNDSDTTIIAPLAVKIFAAIPVLMVDEHAITVSDHLIIHSFLQNESKERPKCKPVVIPEHGFGIKTLGNRMLPLNP
ncbi:hypothetical protein BDN71DRAFT_1504872 [Pleurotus eryngii]|uniref:Uncharacterized protein n=1 Tax=Pleurotus eryngii TaxID=5323 RepID=A0A9P6A3W6_PLEER|nr:hypothetical protein BDN71DRAFT_1504872 [Pleurotus eryngii]